MNKSKEFFSKIESLAIQKIPDDVMARARRSLLDYIAVSCAGAGVMRDKISAMLDFSAETGAFRVHFTGRDTSLGEAVFLNGLIGHALDLDDGTNAGIIHLGTPIFSLLLPLATRLGATLDDVLRCAVIGYEVSFTLAISIQPTHKMRGFHATGTCGTVGAALAAAHLLGFNEKERWAVFGAACLAASGMLKALDDQSECKPYNAAKATLLAWTALQTAKAPLAVNEDPLGGRGFLFMMTGEEDRALAPILKNGTYAIMKSYTKPYASCRYTHPAVEGAIALGKTMDWRTIQAVRVKTYRLAVAGHDHQEIRGPMSAKMSIPYAVAAGLIYGKAGPEEFDETVVLRKEVLDLTRKITVEEDATISDIFPEKQAAIVEVYGAQGTASMRVDFPKGEPENPLTDEEFRQRFDDLCAFGGTKKERSDQIFSLVYQSGTMTADLVKCL